MYLPRITWLYTIQRYIVQRGYLFHQGIHLASIFLMIDIRGISR